MIISVIFFVWVATAAILGLANPVVRHIAMATSIATSKESFYAAEAGIEDVAYRLNSGMATVLSQTLNVGNHSVTTTVADGSPSENKIVTATGQANDYFRKVEVVMTLGKGQSFFYGIQSHLGGIIIENSASVEGNAFSNGTIVSSINGRIKGDAVSADSTGLLDGVHTTGNAYAHTIRDSYIEKDAFYQIISDTTVLGSLHPASGDQSTSTMPISDAQIEGWKVNALSGGTETSPCPYTISASVLIGPKIIDCDLIIDGTNFTVTLGGALWVKGNVTIKNTPTIKIASTQQNRSVAIIADNPSNPAGSGKISLENSPTFLGTGLSSYVFMISQNNSAENGGDGVAIDVKNTANGDLVVYAGHGEIVLQNSANLREISGYRLRLKNNSLVRYEIGLQSTLFSAGPSGGLEVLKWKEIE